MKALKLTTENPELADRFNQVLSDTVTALEQSGIRYAFIGGIASGGLGRPRSTHDIDVFVRPEDAEIALRFLAKQGFRTEKTDPSWLYKAFKESILVDIIFKSKGEIYLDSEMFQKSLQAEFHGKQLRLVAPEDLVIIKAVAHSELTPGHWHDALGLLSHATLDWDYLIHRARKAPRRVLSLLIYAQSSDVWVPKKAIDQLYQICFGDFSPVPSSAQTINQFSKSMKLPPTGTSKLNHYAISHLRSILAEDPRTSEMDILIEECGGKILLRGDVLTEERREALTQIVKERYPECEVENQTRLIRSTPPQSAEDMK